MLKKHELSKIVDSIREAESKSSAEVRVCVAKKCSRDPLDAAYSKFIELEMDNTFSRNSVLIYVAPNNNKAAIIGDVGINKVVSERFWDSTLKEMIELFKNSNSICEGICYGVKRVGELMRDRFPVSENDINELSDEVIIDEE